MINGINLANFRAFHFMSAAKLVPILYPSVPISSLFGCNQNLNSYFYIGSVVVLAGVLLISLDRKKYNTV